MDSTNTTLSYLKSVADSNGRVSISLANIANEIGLSVATVHRVVKKLEEDKELYIEHSRPKNQPDTIVLLNSESDIFPITSEIEIQTNTMLTLVKELTNRIAEKQKEVIVLRNELDRYQKRHIINEIKVADDVVAVFYKT